jgi:hypothetical protein
MKIIIAEAIDAFLEKAIINIIKMAVFLYIFYPYIGIFKLFAIIMSETP